jgi:hypothetical protein
MENKLKEKLMTRKKKCFKCFEYDVLLDKCKLEKCEYSYMPLRKKKMDRRRNSDLAHDLLGNIINKKEDDNHGLWISK